MNQPETNLNETIRIAVSNAQAHHPVEPRWVEDVARRTLLAEQIRHATVAVVLTDDASIRIMNARHLGHDWATDVISFCNSEDGDAELVGDLIISAETAVSFATRSGLKPHNELALYLVHGLLHLCGYDDQADADREVMRRREAEILTSLGLNGPDHEVDSASVTSDYSDRESVCWPR